MNLCVINTAAMLKYVVSKECRQHLWHMKSNTVMHKTGPEAFCVTNGRAPTSLLLKMKGTKVIFSLLDKHLTQKSSLITSPGNYGQ